MRKDSFHSGLRRMAWVLGVALATVLATPQAWAKAKENVSAGRLALRNDASIAFGTHTPLRNCCKFSVANTNDSYTSNMPGLVLRPALDYFVIDGLAIGGALEIAYMNISTGFGGGDVITFALIPRIGYSLALVDWLAFWPQFSIGAGFSSRYGNLDAILPIDFFAPFYIHPTDNFFFGVGPAISFQPIDNDAYWSIEFLRFSIGGTFGVNIEAKVETK